jgi:anion-transporting  ArsA/GET3 family ATPase
VDKLLEKSRVIVCAGTGGVGKTTLSAAIGIRAAQLGKRVLVLTIDPARRLADALGVAGIDDEATEVPGQNFKGTLSAAMINPQKVFHRLVEKGDATREEKDQVLSNKIFKQITTNLSGSQEFTALERLHELHESGDYDLIILDTPPAKHAMDFLKAPQKFYSLFQDSVMKWFIKAPEARPSPLVGLFQRGTQIVVKAFEVMGGAKTLEELSEFFKVIHSWQPILQSHSAAIHRLLTARETNFVLITAFDENKIREAVAIERELLRGGYTLGMVIINRVLPHWLAKGAANEFTSQRAASEESKIEDFFNTLRAFFRDREEAMRAFHREVGDQIPFVEVPDFENDMANLGSLEKIAEKLVLISSNEGK